MTQWIFTSCVLILSVLVIRALGKDKLSARLRYALWGLVLLRLLIPGSVGESALSVLNVVLKEPVQQTQLEPFTKNGQHHMIQKSELPVVSDITDMSDVSIPSDTLQTTQTGEATQPSESTVQYVMTEQTEPDKTRNTNPFFVVWVLGMAVTGAVFVLSNLRLTMRLRKSRCLVQVETLPVYETSAVETPCLFGLVRPAVYVTPTVLADERALRHVLAHELTHYGHKDHIWSLLRCVCVTVHWYNPLVWVAAFVSQQDAELACDEGAVQRIGEAERTKYAGTLLELSCGGYKGMLTTATSMTGNESTLKTRILRIVQNPQMPKIAVPVILVLALVIGLVVFTGEKTESFSGTWKSEGIQNELGTEYAPYTYERYTQYELKNGQGRRTTFHDGEVETSERFTYTVHGNRLVISVNESPYWNPDFKPYKDVLKIVGETLVETNASEEETVFYPFICEDPVFLSDELFDLTEVQSWEQGKARRVEFCFDGMDAALLKLLRAADVTVLEGSAAAETEDGYRYEFRNTDLCLVNGVLYDGNNGYLLSNIKEIEYLFSSVAWEFVEPPTDAQGMPYYINEQTGQINICFTYSHGYREKRYYVPENQREWQDAIQEVLDNGVTDPPESLKGKNQNDCKYTGFSVSGGDEYISVYPDGVFSFTREREVIEEDRSYWYHEPYYVTAEQAPKLSKLMEPFVREYEESLSMGPENLEEYLGTWVLAAPLVEYGITDMILYLNMYDYFGYQYTIPYSSYMIAKQNGSLMKQEMAVGVTKNELQIRLRDGTEYGFVHTIKDGVLTVNINGAEAIFRRESMALDDYDKMGDVVILSRTSNTYPDVILMDTEERETFVQMVISGLSAKQATENIIVSNGSYYRLPVMNAPLNAEQVILSDLGTIHFQGAAYQLTNWKEIEVFLDSLNLKYTKMPDMYPKG